MEINFKFGIALQDSIYCGQQSWLAIDGHPDIHFHQDPEDLAILDAMSILGRP